MALQKSGLELIAQNAAAYVSDMGRAERANEAFAESASGAAQRATAAGQQISKAAQQSAGLYQDAAGKWRNAAGQYASAAEKAAAGVVGASKKVGDEGGKGYTSLAEIASGALRRVGELTTDFAMEAGQAVAQFVGDSIGAAGDFEAGMNRFAAVAGSALQESGQGLQDFKQLFLDMGAQTQFSAGQAQEAAINLAKGGLDPATIAAGGLKAALDLAAAGELDLAQAAEISAKQYGVWVDASASAADKAAFLAESANLLSQAANASTVGVDDLALGLANAGGVAKVAGLSFRETVTSMALLAPGFSSAADAGTSFKTLISRLVPTTENQADAMARLGLLTAEGTSKFYDAEGSFIGMEAAAELLKGATADLSEEQKQMALNAIFGADAIRAAAILAENGADGYRRMAESMAGAGTAAEQAAARNKGFNFALESAKGSLETFAIVAGSLALPALTSLLNDAVIPFINGATQIAGALGDPTTQLGQIASVISGAVLPTLTGLAAATVAYAVTQLPALSIALQAAIAAHSAQAAAMAATLGPLALIAVAVGGVAFAWNDFQTKLQSATTKLLESKAWWQESTTALETYSASQLATNANVAAAAATVETLRATIEAEVTSLGHRRAAGQVSDAQMAQEIARIDMLRDSLGVATGHLNAQIDATTREAAASMTASTAVATMGAQHDVASGQISLTADQVEQLGAAIQQTYTEGGQAIAAYAQTEAGFLDGVEQRRADHAAKIAELEAQKREATTAEQAAAIDEQIAQATAAYTEQETAQATSYAEQQAAQRAHLGQMLIDYTVSQAQLGNITKTKAAEITAALEAEYGLQESSTATTFLNMASSIDQFANDSGASIDGLIGDLEAQETAAVSTERAMTAMSKEYVATAVANFVEKGGEADAYAQKLRSIPSEVRTRVHTEYTESGGTGGSGNRTSGGGYSGTRALGGPVKAALTYLVGEKGPELFVPSSAGRIIPADKTRAIQRGSGGGGRRGGGDATQAATTAIRDLDRVAGYVAGPFADQIDRGTTEASGSLDRLGANPFGQQVVAGAKHAEQAMGQLPQIAQQAVGQMLATVENGSVGLAKAGAGAGQTTLTSIAGGMLDNLDVLLDAAGQISKAVLDEATELAGTIQQAVAPLFKAAFQGAADFAGAQMDALDARDQLAGPEDAKLDKSAAREANKEREKALAELKRLQAGGDTAAIDKDLSDLDTERQRTAYTAANNIDPKKREAAAEKLIELDQKRVELERERTALEAKRAQDIAAAEANWAYWHDKQIAAQDEARAKQAEAQQVVEAQRAIADRATAAMTAAEQRAAQEQNPAARAKLLAFETEQITKRAALEQQIAGETDAAKRARLEQRLQLLTTQQAAEQALFEQEARAAQAAFTTDLRNAQDAAKRLGNLVFYSQEEVHGRGQQMVKDVASGIIAQLGTLQAQLRAGVGAPAQISAPPAPNYSYATTTNAPTTINLDLRGVSASDAATIEAAIARGLAAAGVRADILQRTR